MYYFKVEFYSRREKIFFAETFIETNELWREIQWLTNKEPPCSYTPIPLPPMKEQVEPRPLSILRLLGGKSPRSRKTSLEKNKSNFR